MRQRDGTAEHRTIAARVGNDRAMEAADLDFHALSYPAHLHILRMHERGVHGKPSPSSGGVRVGTVHGFEKAPDYEPVTIASVRGVAFSQCANLSGHVSRAQVETYAVIFSGPFHDRYRILWA